MLFRSSLTYRETIVQLTAREFFAAALELGAFDIEVRKLLPEAELCETSSYLAIFRTDMMFIVTL